MNWSQVCDDKLLQDLPYKIELNEWGNIVMSPASNRRGNIQTKIAFSMMSWMAHGTVLTECSVSTSNGNVTFYNYRGRMSASGLFPKMDNTIEVDA